MQYRKNAIDTVFLLSHHQNIKFKLSYFYLSKHLKFILFLQIKDIFDTFNEDTSWDDFTSIISQDDRIGESHMLVPGPDGKKGFGGACFTKDTAALLKYSQNIDKSFDILNEVISINNKIRLDYQSLDEREKDQNVNYEFIQKS